MAAAVIAAAMYALGVGRAGGSGRVRPRPMGLQGSVAHGQRCGIVESKQARLTAGTESVATAAARAVCASSRRQYLLPTRHLSRSDGRRGESEGPRSMGWPYLLPRHKLCEVAPGDGLVSQASRRGEARCSTNHTATCVGGRPDDLRRAGGCSCGTDEHSALPGQKLCTTPRYDLWRSCVGDVPTHRSLASRVIEPTTDLQATPEKLQARGAFY